MLNYVLRRLLYIVVVFIVASIIIFGIFKLVPGDPATMMLEGNKTSMKPEEYQAKYEQARAKLGLDQPIPVQYVKWMFNMLTGDFGYSTQFQKPVREIIGTPMKNTILLNVATLIPIFLITIPLGIATAVRKGSKFDTGVQIFTIIGYSLPFFVIALLFIYFFAVKIEIFPISGAGTPNFQGTAWEAFLDKLKYMALPCIVVIFSSLGSLTRYVRATMIEALRMDCIKTARAKGLKEKVVIYSHAFRNALIPFITVVAGWFLSIFSGSVVIERTFLWRGMGNTLVTSMQQLDYMVAMTLLMFYLVLSLVGNLVIDLLYGVVDPRVKLS